MSFAKVHETSGLLAGFDVLSLSVSGAVFVGVGGVFNSTGGIDHSAATGFYANGVTLNYVSATTGTETYTAYSLHAASLGIVGVSGLTLNVTNLVIEHNEHAGGTANVDWGSLGVSVALAASVTDTFSADFTAALGTGGVALAAGHVSFAKVHESSGLLAGFDVLSLSVSGSVFVGVGGVFDGSGGIDHSAATGFYANGVTLNYVSATTGTETYTAYSLHAASLGIVGVSGLTLNVTNLVIEHNEHAGGTANVDWGSLGVSVALAASVTDTFSADFTAALGTGGVALAAGHVSFAKVAGASSTALAGFDILTLHVSGSAFVGVGGVFNAAGDDIVTTNATGFYASGVALDYVSATNATDTFTGLHLHADTLAIVGVTDLQFYVTNLNIDSNKTTSLGGKLDWSLQTGQSLVTLPSTTSDLDISASLGIDLASGFVAASGTVHFTTVSITGGVLTGPQTALKLTVTDGQLWAGVGGGLDAVDHHTVHEGSTGISAHDVSFTYVSVKDGITTYSGLELTVGTASLIGISGVQLYVTGLDIKVNKATGVVTPLNWGDFPILGFTLSGATDLSVGATLGIDIGNGFVVASGTFTLTRSIVSGIGGPITSQTALKLTITGADLWAGVGGSLDPVDHHTVTDGTAGISAHGVDITLASVSTPTASYTGLLLHATSASLNGIPGVSAYVTGLDVQVNKSTALTPLNWSTLTIDGGGTFGFNLSAATDLSVVGTLGVDIGNGFVAASGTFSFERDVVSGAGLTHATALKLTVSDAHLWVGVGGSLDAVDHHTVHPGTIGIDVSGVDLKLAAISSGPTSYTGLELKIASASLIGVPERPGLRLEPRHQGQQGHGRRRDSAQLVRAHDRRRRRLQLRPDRLERPQRRRDARRRPRRRCRSSGHLLAREGHRHPAARWRARRRP